MPANSTFVQILHSFVYDLLSLVKGNLCNFFSYYKDFQDVIVMWIFERYSYTAISAFKYFINPFRETAYLISRLLAIDRNFITIGSKTNLCSAHLP
jgi:hypothetical protein